MSYSATEDMINSPGNTNNARSDCNRDEGNAQIEGQATARKHSQLGAMASEATPLLPNTSRGDEYSPTTAMYVLTFFAALGGFLFGYDTGVISGALLPITRIFHLNDLWKEVIVSSTVGAAIFGAVSGGWFNDKFGRKLVLITSSVIFVAGAVLMAVASNKELLMIGRLVVGVAIGNSTYYHFR